MDDGTEAVPPRRRAAGPARAPGNATPAGADRVFGRYSGNEIDRVTSRRRRVAGDRTTQRDIARPPTAPDPALPPSLSRPWGSPSGAELTSSPVRIAFRRRGTRDRLAVLDERAGSPRHPREMCAELFRNIVSAASK